MINFEYIFQDASFLTTSIGCFCEKFSNGISQPMNSTTSLIFVLIGLIILFKYLHKANKILTILFVLALFTTGFGSAYYHAKFNMLGQTLDVLGMFLILIAGPIALLENRSSRYKLVTFFLFSHVIGTFLIISLDIRRYVFVLSVVILLYYERNRVTKYLKSGLLIFTVAMIIWIIDNYQIYCNQSIILNMHSWWHILTAWATFLLYKHFDLLSFNQINRRTERSTHNTPTNSST